MRLRVGGAQRPKAPESPAPGGFERRSFWQATASIDPGTDPDIPLPDRADVVVIGGGYTGITTALFLARSGARVVLLEARTFGWGASSRNGGMVHGGLTWSRTTLRRRYGTELGDRLDTAAAETFGLVERFILDEGFDCDYVRSGRLVLAWSRADADRLAAKAAALTASGHPARIVQGADLRAEIGTSMYDVGLLDELAGGLHPARYLAGLVTRARSAGADLRSGTPAFAVERQTSGLVVTTSRGTIAAADVVLATNGYTGNLVPWVQRRVLPIGSYIIVTEPLDPAVAREVSPRGRMFSDTKNFLYYWRLAPDGRMLFGGRASFAPTTVDRTAAILERALRQVHPQLVGSRTAYAWGGLVGFTFDRLPHIGRRDGVTYALGYCGQGVCMATYFGMTVAAMLGRGSERPPVRSPFEEIPHPAAAIPGVYRGNPWFLPAVGLAFRAQDAVGRRR